MELTLRAFVTAGVALTAANAIALAPAANAYSGTSGTDHRTHTGGAATPTGKLTSTVKAPRRTIAPRRAPPRR